MIESSELLHIRTEEGIHYLTLNRPDKRNALNRELVEVLAKAFLDADQNESIRAIILSGAGDVFSAGADLEALQALQDASYEDNLRDSRALAELFDAMHQCSKPIIGAINGHAIAGGCGLATLCDITVAPDTARFGYTETRIGFVPALVARFALSKIGETQSRKLLLSGTLIDAVEAARIGLITEVCTADTFDERIAFWADVFRSQVSPQAVATTRELLRTASSMSWEEALEYAIRLNAKARETSDCKKGVAAFLNKEKHSW
ncbi:MAG: enoyl-CoA hydratase/isomerase family protein [Bacteroidetes bacterium]|nr:enoyl-CoA hydratase/isomerase family protein [Bacteroidota bacterium]